MMRRRGFTLIELVVAMAILLVLIYMGFAAFSFVGAMSKSQQSREAALESVSTVLDQMTKELRQSVTYTSSHAPFNGIVYPASSGTRDIASLLASTSPIPGDGLPYVFDSSKGPIVRFFTMGDDGIYRISYTLGVPSGGGIAQRYWADPDWQPCEILYTREKWNDADSDWVVDSGELTTVVDNQSVSEQVISDLAIVRPSWSDKVIQVVVKTMVKDSSGRSTEITRITQVALRQ
jgi:prepilin-type N-terminal cleavage/methylation domain-containing protein